MKYQLSPAGDALVKEFEEFRAKAYLDAKKVPTIGYGTTRIKGVPVKLGMTCTMEQALEWKRDDDQQFLADIERLVKVPLTQNQVDALVSFVYNVGAGGFSSSTLLKAINSSKPVFEDYFVRWNKVRDPKTGKLVVLSGLTRRRQAEYKLYIS